MKKIDRYEQKIKSEFPLVFPKKDLLIYLKRLHEKKEIGADIRSTISSNCRKVPIKWNRNPEYNLVSFHPDDVKAWDVIQALQKKYYLSHHTAMYLNELTDQRPSEFYLTKEVAPKSIERRYLGEDAIQQAFRKDYRITSNFFHFQKIKYNLVQKSCFADKIGVRSRTLHQGTKKQDHIWFTDIERTFLDCIIGPQYSGGMRTILSCYSEAIIKMDRLYEYYKIVDPQYPYWQLIGFIFKVIGRRKESHVWGELFHDKKRIKFFFDKNFRSNWEYDEEWCIYHPGWVDYD